MGPPIHQGLLLRLVALILVSRSASSPLSVSWDTVPTYSFPCFAGRPFNTTELNFLAQFPLVILCHAYQWGGNTTNHTTYAEDAMGQTARQLKAISPSIRVIFYINSALDYKDYSFSTKLHARPDLWVRYPSGEPYYIGCIDCPVPDFSLAAGRELFVQEYMNATRTYGYAFDGLFADRAAGAPSGCRNESGYALGHGLVMQELQQYMDGLGKGGVTIPNNVVYDKVDGTMIEGFRANISNLRQLAAAGRNGRLVLVHAGYLPDGSDNHCDNITNALAAFLVSAGERSMFACSTGAEPAQ